MLNVSKMVTFEFRDGTIKTYKLGSSIKGLRDAKGRRAIKARLNFSKDEELSKVEKEWLYCIVYPSIDPVHGEVIYDCNK